MKIVYIFFFGFKFMIGIDGNDRLVLYICINFIFRKKYICVIIFYIDKNGGEYSI